jgi:hypothetical protein
MSKLYKTPSTLRLTSNPLVVKMILSPQTQLLRSRLMAAILAFEKLWSDSTIQMFSSRARPPVRPMKTQVDGSVHYNLVQQTLPSNSFACIHAATTYTDDILLKSSLDDIAVFNRAIYYARELP